jgi:hypothetical protein
MDCRHELCICSSLPHKGVAFPPFVLLHEEKGDGSSIAQDCWLPKGECVTQADHINWPKKRKDSAGSDDTASMINGGGYLGARTRQPPTAQTIVKKKLIWVRGVVCRSTRTQSLTVVACVVLQCIACFYECRCMSDGC